MPFANSCQTEVKTKRLAGHPISIGIEKSAALNSEHKKSALIGAIGGFSLCGFVR